MSTIVWYDDHIIIGKDYRTIKQQFVTPAKTLFVVHYEKFILIAYESLRYMIYELKDNWYQIYRICTFYNTVAAVKIINDNFVVIEYNNKNRLYTLKIHSEQNTRYVCGSSIKGCIKKAFGPNVDVIDCPPILSGDFNRPRKVIRSKQLSDLLIACIE